MKKFKTKRKNNNKIVMVILIIISMLMFIWFSLQKLDHSEENFISFLFLDTAFKGEKQINNSFKLEYLFKNHSFYEKAKISNSKKIYLYNTHNQEKYIDNSSVYDASESFASNLKKLGFTPLLENKKTSDFLYTGMSYYDISRIFIKDIKEKEDIDFFIDIHRDSVSNTSVTINNKRYAKILFVLGLDNPSFEDNKRIIKEMNNYLDINYPGISKGILEKSGSGVDGIYNQDLDSHVMLIEIGGIENNFEEVNNSTEILSLMLYHFIGEK